ncbi:Nicotinamide mononucleotide adenylyltransferase 1 [Camponotus japonicus]
MAPTRVILMSCGSYNPPTNMHLRMFEIARDHLHRMGTHIVVGGVISPVHDAYAKKELASATHRCEMLRLALQNSDWIRLSTWETRQNCWTKTRLCLQHHQNLLNSMLCNSNDIKHHMQMDDTEWIPENVKNCSDNTPIQIKLLCGADLLESFGICGLWLEEDIDAIIGEHGLVVITREGCNPNKFIYDSDILSKHMHNICIVTEWIPNEVSSTRIRRALKRSQSIRYLLQDSVIDYIYKHEIYDARAPNTTIKLELPSPNANNYLHIDPRYLTAFLTPSPSDVTMDSPSPIEIAASIDVPDAVVLRKNLQNAGSGGGLDEIREHILSAISNNADNGNVKHVARAAYPGQAKQIIASETGVMRIIDEVGPLDEPTAKFQSGSSLEEGYKPRINSVVRDKEGSDLKSDAANLGSNEIIMQIQASQLSSNEPTSIEDCKLLIESIGKDKIEIGQREVSDLRSKTEIAVVDLGSNNDREIIMKIQPSQPSSSELRLGECCWPTRESTADDKIKICDRKITSEREIIDVELGLDDKITLAPKEKPIADAISDRIDADRSSISKIKLEKSPEMTVKSVAKEKVDIGTKKINSKKEIVDVELDFIDANDDVVKVQPVHSNHSIVRLQEDRKLMIEKLTNELKSKLDEERNKSKENLQLDKVGKNDTELSRLNSERKNIEIISGKEIANLELDKIGHLETKAITSSLNISASLDGRHECALSDFSVDKEDYRLNQYGFNDEDEEEKESVYIARSSLMKCNDQREDKLDEFVSDNKTNAKENNIQSTQVLVSAMIHESHEKGSDYFTTEEIDNRTKSAKELDQSKFVVEWSQAEIEAKEKKVDVEDREQSEEVSEISREIDKVSRMDEFDTHSSERRTTSCDSSLEIDGKYLKSIVNSRKSPRKIRVDQIRDFEFKEQYTFIDEPEAVQSEELQSSSTKTSSERIKEEQIYDIDANVEKKDKIFENQETSRAEKVFQGSSRSASVKVRSPKKIAESQVDEGEREFKDRERSINVRETFHAEKVFQSSSKSASIKNPKKVGEIQTDKDECEFKDQDQSINDRESSQAEKASQKSSRTSISAKNPKKSKQSQIFYRSDEMKNYDRSINDRVISQLEAVFQDSSKKSSAKTEISKKSPENCIELKKQTRSADNRESFRSEEFSQHSSKTSSTKSPKKTPDQKIVRLNDKTQQGQETIKTTKDADNRTKRDFNEIKDVYTRKVRRYNVPLQGSLDSMIMSDEASAQKPKKDEAFSKKSKSYESIKRIQEVFLGVPSTKTNNSGSQLDIPDEFCSICCYMNEITFRTEEEVSSPNQETFYTLRSTCSSLADDDDEDNDSIECDICGSLNLQESTDDLEDKIQEIPCELCRICGEVDGSFDQDSMPIDRYAFKLVEHQDDDDSFEIENCGFQSGTESADDRSRLSEKEKIKDTGRPKSQSLFIHGSSMIKDQPRELYFIPKDEIAILTSGARRISRKGSLFRKKEDFDGSARDKRRYSSVDSLQLAKMSPKAGDKALKTTKDPTLIGSADNLRITKDSRRSKSLQRSTDDVDRLNLSTDNLNSMENLEKVSEAEGLAEKSNIRDKEAVKMILTQHGIKVISEKETAL